MFTFLVQMEQGKKKKRKGEPKGALSSYVLFTIATRPIIAEKFPDVKGHDVMKKLGEMWKEANEEEKKVTNQFNQLMMRWWSFDRLQSILGLASFC